MPFEFLGDIATSDVAFHAWGQTVEEMFSAAADAVMNVMVADLSAIAFVEERECALESEALDMLLFGLLQELIFYKDAEQLLLRVADVAVGGTEGNYNLTARLTGESIDSTRHDLIVDVKAVTLHRFSVEQTHKGWETLVILDI